MPDLRVRRTLVKSPPELWAELSEVDGLARHLGEFGEITITRAQPETTVAWEGDSARGIVELEPTGWGTKVTITAQVPEPEPVKPEAVEPEPEEPEPEEPVEPEEPDGGPKVLGPDPDPFDPDPDPFDPDPDPFDPGPEAFEPPPGEPEPDGPEPRPKRRGALSRWLFRERRTGPEPLTEGDIADLRMEAEAEAELPPVEPEPELPPVDAETQLTPDEPEPTPEPESHDKRQFVGPDEDFEFDFEIRRASIEEQTTSEEEPGPAMIDPERAREVLEATLENLGQAHHRPFSRG